MTSIKMRFIIRTLLPLLIVIASSIGMAILMLGIYKEPQPVYWFFFGIKWLFTSEETAPAAISSLLCCCLFGFFWYRNSGLKRFIYYLIFIFFGLMVSFGSLAYLLITHPITTIGDGPVEVESFVPYGIAWFIFVLLAVIFEFYSSRKK